MWSVDSSIVPVSLDSLFLLKAVPQKGIKECRSHGTAENTDKTRGVSVRSGAHCELKMGASDTKRFVVRTGISGFLWPGVCG